MPQIVAAVVAIAEAVYTAVVAVAAVEIAAGITIGSILVSTIVSAGLSYAASLLSGTKKKQVDQNGQTLTFRAPTAPATIIYGDTRVGGVIAFIATSSSATGVTQDNKYLHLVVILAGHEVDAIGDVLFNDEVLDLDANGIPISSVATGPAGGLRDFCVVKKHLGAWDQAAEPMLVAAFGASDGFTTADRFRGCAYLYVRLLYDTDGNKWPNGVPNISARVRGRKVYDPRNPAHAIGNPSTWTWTDNSALCIADYMRGVPMFVGENVVDRIYGVRVPDASIDWTAVTAAANISDETVYKNGGGVEERYTCNGVMDSSVVPGAGLEALKSSIGGRVVWSGGQWSILAGAWRAPTIALTDDDQAGEARNQPRRSRRDLFNGVRGTYKGPLTQYQPADFPAVTNATYKAQDNGESIWQEIELPFTDTPSMAQRIAKIELERNRQQITTQRRLKLTGLRIKAGSTTSLTDARKGWAAKAFEVLRWGLVNENDAGGSPVLIVDVTLGETASTVFDWNSGEETVVDAAPDTNLPRPWEVAAAGSPGIIETLYQTRQGGGVKTKLTVTWSASIDAYLQDYILQYKLTADSAWTTLSPVVAAQAIIEDVAAGIYDFRVKARNVLGVSSDWSEHDALTVYGLGATPSTLTGLGIQPLGNHALLKWDQSPDLDVREGGRIEFRHSSAISGATWSASQMIADSVPGNATGVTVPLKRGTYLLRPVDSSEIAGVETTVSSKQASINGYTSAGGSPIAEQTTFTGTKTNTTAGGGVLKNSNLGLWDDIADVDGLLTNVDDTGGISPTGSYDFATAFNFGAIGRFRLTSKITLAIVSTLNQIDDRVALIDDWEDFDGSPNSGGDAWVEFRQTDNDPTGSPTWTPWMRLDTAEVEAWGVQGRCQIVVDDPSFNVEVSVLEIAAESRT